MARGDLSPPLAQVEFPGREVLAQLLACCLHEPGMLQEAPDLISGGVATDILFLEHLPRVHPIPDAADDVLEDPRLALRSAGGAEELIPEGSSSLGHCWLSPSFPLRSTEETYPKIVNSRQRRLAPTFKAG